MKRLLLILSVAMCVVASGYSQVDSMVMSSSLHPCLKIRIWVLIDVSGSMASVRDLVCREVHQVMLLEQSPALLQIGLMTFDDGGYVWTEPTSHPGSLWQATFAGVCDTSLVFDGGTTMASSLDTLKQRFSSYEDPQESDIWNVLLVVSDWRLANNDVHKVTEHLNMLLNSEVMVMLVETNEHLGVGNEFYQSPKKYLWQSVQQFRMLSIHQYSDFSLLRILASLAPRGGCG
jgi:hypothetical protein